MSRGISPDVDGWIRQANKVQTDIQASKTAAREIVVQHETHLTLQASVADAAQNVMLLEEELRFSTSLQSVLEEIKAISQKLTSIKALLVKEQVLQAHKQMKAVSQALRDFEDDRSSNAVRTLQARYRSIESDLKSMITEHIMKMNQFNIERRSVTFESEEVNCGDATVADCITILTDLDASDALVQDMSRELHEAFFGYWVQTTPSTNQYRLEIKSNTASLSKQLSKPDLKTVILDIQSFITFLCSHMSEKLYVLLSARIMPAFLDQFENRTLSNALPLSLDEMSAFAEIKDALTNLAKQMISLSWDGGNRIANWVDNIPLMWLDKQRECTLDRVRKSLLTDVRKTRSAQRFGNSSTSSTETKPKIIPSPDKQVQDHDVNDEDASAWEMETHDEHKTDTPESTIKVESDTTGWGWEGEGDDAVRSPAKTLPNSHEFAINESTKTNDQAANNPETYETTAVPESLIAICMNIFKEAHMLIEDQPSSWGIASAVEALPTIAVTSFALYRAMSLTAYNKTINSKILLHNDSIRISELMSEIISSHYSPNSRTTSLLSSSTVKQLEQEISIFTSFANQALSSELDSQRTVLNDLLDGAQGFSDCTKSPMREECDSAVSSTVDRIRDLSTQWMDILPRGDLLRCLGILLDGVVRKIMNDVMDLGDIGAEESTKLVEWLRKISGLSDIFQHEDKGTEEKNDTTPNYCLSWFKFQYFIEILEGTLADIKYLWLQGELSLEFTEEEIVDLIEALFANSEYRRKAISEIKAK